VVPGLRPLALISLRDELRPNVAETIKGFQEAGVQLKVISGDNPETVATAIRIGHPQSWDKAWKVKEESNESDTEANAAILEPKQKENAPEQESDQTQGTESASDNAENSEPPEGSEEPNQN